MSSDAAGTVDGTAAAEEENAVVADDRFVVIDTETTGLDPAHDRVVSIGLVPVIRGAVAREAARHVLVSPGVPIPPTSTAIHGIVDTDVQDAPELAEAVADLSGLWSGQRLAGHNLEFDLAFLAPAGLQAEQTIDTLAASRLLWPRRGTSHTLDAVADRLGVTPEDRHTAVGDAITTAEVLCALLPLLRERGLATPDAVTAAIQRQNAYRSRLRRSIRRRSRNRRPSPGQARLRRRTLQSARPRR